MANRDSSFSETHWKPQRKPKTDGRTADSDGGMRGEGRRVNDERRTSRRLRTTMSAHHVVFPSSSSSVCLHPSLPPSLRLYYHLSSLSPLSHVFLYLLLLLFLTPPSLPLCMFLPLLFRSHSFLLLLLLLCFHSCLSLQLCTCSLDYSLLLFLFFFLSFLISHLIMFMHVHTQCRCFLIIQVRWD